MVVVSGTQITATTPAGSAGAVTVTVTVNSQSGSLSNGLYLHCCTDGEQCIAADRIDDGRDGGDDHGDELCGRSDGDVRRDGSHERGGGERDADHGDDAGGKCGCGDGNGDQPWSAKREFGQRIYVCSGTDGERVSPNSGSTTGGTAVTITGTNFAAGATVTFGGTAATNVVVVSGTQITATTPAHAAGAVTVTVTVNGQSGSLSNGFTYNPVVAISFAQVAAATPQSPTATVSVTYPAAQTAGDLNVVVVGWNDTTSTVQSVKDSGGNNYSLAIGPTTGTALRQSIYYLSNIAGGQQHGDGDVQPSGSLSGCAHTGVPWSDDVWM